MSAKDTTAEIIMTTHQKCLPLAFCYYIAIAIVIAIGVALVTAPTIYRESIQVNFSQVKSTVWLVVIELL
jgi:hypothetical protein